VWRRYQGRRPKARHAFWWPHAPVKTVPGGARLAIALPGPAIVHWGNDGWQNAADTPTKDSGLGFHVAALDVGHADSAVHIDFTWRRQDTGAWAGRDYTVAVMAPDGSP
jgi:glucoamylase